MNSILQQAQREYGWSQEYAHKVWNEYLKFMNLRSKDPSLSPSNEIDKLWHQHILNTKHYREFCLKYFKKFIDHDPEDAKDQPTRVKRLDNTITHYDDLYKKSPPANIWNRDTIDVYLIYAFDVYKDGTYIGKRPKENSGYKYDRKVIRIPFTGDIKKEVSRAIAGKNFNEKGLNYSSGYDVYLFDSKDEYFNLLKRKDFTSNMSYRNNNCLGRVPRMGGPMVAVLEEMTSNGYC